MVVKKNKSVLAKLIKDLKKIGPLLSEIPALIIDDESDQASVNTTDPKKWEEGKVARTAINSQISQLLGLLPAPSTSATRRRPSPTSSSTRATARTSSRATS